MWPFDLFKKKQKYGPDYYKADGQSFLDFEKETNASRKSVEGVGKITWHGIPSANAYGNAYGSIWGEHENGVKTTVICGHGGSMWMCLNCAQATISGTPLIKPCPHHVGEGPFNFTCGWPGCKLSFWE